jgi:hypothetical protein
MPVWIWSAPEISEAFVATLVLALSQNYSISIVGQNQTKLNLTNLFFLERID